MLYFKYAVIRDKIDLERVGKTKNVERVVMCGIRNGRFCCYTSGLKPNEYGTVTAATTEQRRIHIIQVHQLAHYR